MAKITTLFLALFLFGAGNSMFGQTAAQLKDKYGEPMQAYSVSEHVWMTPKFTSDGQLCEMRLYPKHISHTTN
jgi:hypothetical protein